MQEGLQDCLCIHVLSMGCFLQGCLVSAGESRQEVCILSHIELEGIPALSPGS